MFNKNKTIWQISQKTLYKKYGRKQIQFQGMMHKNGEKTNVRLGFKEINTEIDKVIMGGK